MNPQDLKANVIVRGPIFTGSGNIGPRTMTLAFRSCGFIFGFYLPLRRWDFLPPEPVSTGPPPLTHASTSGNLHFHRRPTRWAGSPLCSIQRYTVSAATPRCAATSFTENQRRSADGMLSEIDIDQLL